MVCKSVDKLIKEVKESIGFDLENTKAMIFLESLFSCFF